MTAQLFSSFWMGGFESACHVNRKGVRLNMVAASQHDRAAREDYRRLRSVDIAVAREGVGWPFVERAGEFDFSALVAMAAAARDEGVQVNWTLCHYGWPDDLDVFAPAFVDRFARYARATARVLSEQSDEVPWYTLVNEISFLAWAAGDCGLIYPHARSRGQELKRQLVRATVAGIDAVREVDARARFLHVDPIIRVVPRRDRPDDAVPAARYAESQHEAWDMLSGRLEPELGGRPDYLDVMGFNFYHSNQWEYEGERLKWEVEPRDSRWTPLHAQLAEMWSRYQRPLVLAETSHVGVGRPAWIAEIGVEVAKAIDAGVPVEGVCLYPVVDRHDWEDPTHWHNSGLWDLVEDGDGRYERVIDQPYAQALRQAQTLVAAALDRRQLPRTRAVESDDVRT